MHEFNYTSWRQFSAWQLTTWCGLMQPNIWALICGIYFLVYSNCDWSGPDYIFSYQGHSCDTVAQIWFSETWLTELTCLQKYLISNLSNLRCQSYRLILWHSFWYRLPQNCEVETNPTISIPLKTYKRIKYSIKMSNQRASEWALLLLVASLIWSLTQEQTQFCRMFSHVKATQTRNDPSAYWPWTLVGLVASVKSQILSHWSLTASGVMGLLFCLTIWPWVRSQRTAHMDTQIKRSLHRATSNTYSISEPESE